jgi:hypothetical protein
VVGTASYDSCEPGITTLVTEAATISVPSSEKTVHQLRGKDKDIDSDRSPASTLDCLSRPRLFRRNLVQKSLDKISLKLMISC